MITDDYPVALFSRAGLRYEVALDVIGAVIPHYAEEAGIERRRPAPDETKLRQAIAMQQRLRSERNQ